MARRGTAPVAPAGTCSINVRLSRAAGEENLSLEGMLADARALAAREGLRVVAEHVDDGVSGAVRNRPGFVAWLDDAREGRVDTLVAWHVDRMTREGVNVAALILDAIEGKDRETGKVVRGAVRLLDTKGLDSRGDDTAFRFRFVIAAEVARAERERMRDRSSNARRRALAVGRWPGGSVPYGYRVVDNVRGGGKVLSVAEDEAALVREAVARVLAGETLAAVVRWANGPGGCGPRRAPRWSRVTMRQVLTGSAVAGRVVRIVDGVAVPLLDADGVPLTVPAILSADESAAVRQALTPVPDARKGGRRPARLLSGLLSCHSCGTTMAVSRRTSGTVTYRCAEAMASAGSCARPVSITASLVEAHVEGIFLGAMGGAPEYVRRAEVAGAAAVEIAEEHVAEALAGLAQVATAEAFERLQRAQAEREVAMAAPREATVRLVATGRTVGEAWERADLHARRDLLAANISLAVVLPGKRGVHGLDAARVQVMLPPAFVDGEPIEGYRRGAVVGEGL